MTPLPVYFLFWLVLMLLAIGNGILRELTYGKYVSELHAHQLSTLIAVIIFGVAVWLLSRRSCPDTSKQAIFIGLIWLVLTLGFEFIFGHYVAGHSWSRLLQDYDLSSGRIWLLLLIWITLLPYLAYKAHKTTT